MSAGAPDGRSLRALFVNENVGGHATMHLGLQQTLPAHPEVDPQFLDVPERGLVRRAVSAQIPGLDRIDCDLQPLRAQLAQSMWTRHALRRPHRPFDVVHCYTQNVALLSVEHLRQHASIVATDATTAQNASMLPYRVAGPGTAQRIRLSRRFEDRVYRAATFVVGQSEWAAASLRDTYGVPADRVRVIPYGIVVPDDAPRAEPEVPAQLTFVGSTMARKGGDRLIEVFRRHLRGRCELNIVTRDEVRPEPGIRVHRDFEPGDPRLAHVLAQTAVFVFPSLIDTFGYAPLEAMAAGVPVVAMRTAARPEFVVDGRTGLLVDPDASDAELCRAILALVEDPQRRRAMGRAARTRVLERFDARITTAALVDLLHEARERHATAG